MSFSKPTATAKLPVGGSFAHSGSFVLGSLNKLSGSSFKDRSQLPHIISFKDGWRKGPTEAWYQTQREPGKSTTFTYLEYRKERESPFYHEFILVELDNKTVCRFDRRGDINNRANVLVGEPIPSEDSAHVIDTSTTHYSEIGASSDLLLRMHFPQGQDLLILLAICYGIHNNKNTQSYSLTRYNCYFFSWMMVTATARCTVAWAALAQQKPKWGELVAAVMKGLGRNDPGPGLQGAIPAILASKSKGNTRPLFQFVGSAYLISTLQKALNETREQIRKSLAELILQTTVEKAMHEVSETSAQNAASEAARSHAAQAAQDAAMEAVIETMWRDIISSNEGGDLWETKCMLAKECVQKASAAAADAAGQSRRTVITQAEPTAPEVDALPPPPAGDGAEAVPAPPAKWETAWDASWEENWASGNKSGRQRSNTTGSRSDDSSKASISDRAKAAWIKAWEEACKANEEYVPLISSGVAEYVTKNLPDVLPEVTYQTDTNVLKSMVNALIPTDNSSNSKLQEWVKGRIQEHCQRVFRVTAGSQQPNRAEFEETMKAIWGSTLNCLPDLSESKVVSIEDLAQ
ncbi:unnamed protein product [Rhizoctonia solani]|uniref:Uncharacterized protein n=1 Tax=Rhizoctonia solani TaxID=456999 RepID=A0A8H3C5S0_9AGAM|nr:unnamed protein product [Rhizoctonia solani]